MLDLYHGFFAPLKRIACLAMRPSARIHDESTWIASIATVRSAIWRQLISQGGFRGRYSALASSRSANVTTPAIRPQRRDAGVLLMSGYN